MKQIGFCIALLMTVWFCCKGQTVFELSKEERKKVEGRAGFSFHVAMGPVSPSEINFFIRDYIENKMGPYYISWGSSNITSVGMIGVTASFPITNKLVPRLFLEYAGASKSVRLNSNNERFVINRFAPGALVGYYLETGGFNAFYLEGGAYYGMTSFRGIKANGLGWKLNFGYVIGRPEIRWEIFIGADLPAMRAGENTSNIQKIDLTAPVIGLRLSSN